MPVAPLLRTGRRASPVADPLGEAIARTGDVNAFNPSFALGADRAQHLLYRALGPDGTKPFHALALRRDTADDAWLRTDLTSHAAAHGVAVVADPKAVLLGDDVFATFNTGHSAVRNELYLMRLSPELGPPQRCVFAQRQVVEKNWGFFRDGASLAVLYSVRPLVLLHHTGGVLGSTDDLVFTSGTRSVPTGRAGLGLGPQPVRRGDDLLTIAHEKIVVRGRRAYVGRPVTVVGTTDPSPTLRVGRTRLVHSWSAMRPPKPRHNPNLLFATYFSGLAIEGDVATVGYGINDVSAGFADLEVNDLWP